MTDDTAEDLGETLDLREYESTALTQLLTLGRTTAPNLAEATGIPRARIYDVLETLSNAGYVKVIPGRPKEYEAKHPETILERAIENRRQSFESARAEIDSFRDRFVTEFGPVYERAGEDVTPTEDLFHVVDVGEASETETRRLYGAADDGIDVITKSFAYFESVRPAFEAAYDRGVPIRVLLLDPEHLSAENRPVQADMIERLRADFPDVELRYSEKLLPWRGTIVDPSMDYETGEAIMLVEEKDVPLSMRQAAVTENGSFVAGLGRYFELIWEYDSRPVSDETDGSI
ncbi:Transcriptional regulator TrmB protein [Halorhabdus tiamatea SARL4B]|uniref:Archaeal sugar-specific transcriptional regulator, TrmB family n=1 Tax=Halorhabdus tiamatea SARL4B TaxID=1033806 RepID=F7PJL5_9EURY|nr:helix-turn-helix domain-containing protein [Halorhabdus tiamatea]ERJ06261.1 Transcriptional regulator TrmB protein [Halorhabdus tiamatea SARL4B]CCQ33818.1 archaeal sugar-specific transcriptional regulator, TrmB family [Halorhabdus tiamatea SARL4B]